MTTTATTAGATAAAGTATTPLASLSGNFQDFLKLLMTQLQNQDPTSPLDTNQFTSQLVQFASVEQQINTNTSLTKLIQATQGNEVLQASSLLGKQATVTADHLPLQGGTASLGFNLTAPQPVAIAVTSDSGATLRHATVDGAAGANQWSWDGRDDAGTSLPDGAYRVAATAADGTAVPVTVSGTVTALQRNADSIGLSLGPLSVDLGAVQSVKN